MGLCKFWQLLISDKKSHLRFSANMGQLYVFQKCPPGHNVTKKKSLKLKIDFRVTKHLSELQEFLWWCRDRVGPANQKETTTNESTMQW